MDGVEANFDAVRWRSGVRVGLDYVPQEYWKRIENFTLTEDISGHVQAAYDAMPASGGQIYWPYGRYPVCDVRTDGSSGGKRGIVSYGDGSATHFRKPDDSLLTTATKKRAPVVHAQGGAGFVFRDMKIEGNRSRGAGAPPFAIRWTGNTAYTTGQVVSTKADGTVAATNAELTAANGARTFLVAQDHTSHATDIDNDVPANVTEVTAQPWNELTKTGYLPSADVDSDYRFRHVLYLHGEADYITDCLVENVETCDGKYGGKVFGSGPLYANGVGFGAKRMTTVGCYAHHNGGSNFGGGFNIGCRHVSPKVIGGLSSGIRFDEGSDDGTIVSPYIDGEGTLTNGGILSYKSDRTKIIAPTIRNASLAIWILESLEYWLDPGADVGGGAITIANSTPAGSTIERSGGKIGFFGAAPGSKPSIAGSRGGNVALTDLLTKLATLGLITDGTS